MANDSAICVDLIVIPALIGLVSKEVDRLVSDPPGPLRFSFDMLQTVRFVPSMGENIKGDLPANGVPKSCFQFSTQVVNLSNRGVN